MGRKYLAVGRTAMEPGRRGRRSGLMPVSRTLLAPLVIALNAVTAAAQDDPILASRAAYQEAVRAYQAHDVPAFLAHARDAERLRPDHGGVIYTLASAYALSGDTVEALAMLRRFAALGYFANVSADTDLALLRPLGGFMAVRQALAKNAEPVVRASRAFTLPERDLLTEGIAYDRSRAPSSSAVCITGRSSGLTTRAASRCWHPRR